MELDIRYCTTTDGVRLAYGTVGHGAPVVRVLGWLSNLELEARPDEHPIWGPWQRALAPHHRLVTYDGRGIGLSDRAVDALSLDTRVRDLEAVIDALALPQVALIGTSEGGATAIVYTARHPERVSRLVLYDAVPYSDMGTANPEGFQAFATVVRSFWGQDSPVFRQVFANAFYPDADRTFYDWFDTLQRASATADVAAMHLASLAAYDVREYLAQLAVPTLVLHRRGDAAAPFEGARELAARIPGARLVPLEGRNHFPLPGEAAAAALFPALLAFLHDGDEDTTLPEHGPPAQPATSRLPSAPRPPAVFISYATEDQGRAEHIRAALEGSGISCWIAPRDIPPGANYAEAILAAIAQSRAMVLVFSEHANRSPHVQRELDRAISNDLPVLPVRVADVLPAQSLAYFLSTCQWLDAFSEPLEPALVQLTQRLQQVVTPAD